MDCCHMPEELEEFRYPTPCALMCMKYKIRQHSTLKQMTAIHWARTTINLDQACTGQRQCTTFGRDRRQSRKQILGFYIKFCIQLSSILRYLSWILRETAAKRKENGNTRKKKETESRGLWIPSRILSLIVFSFFSELLRGAAPSANPRPLTSEPNPKSLPFQTRIYQTPATCTAPLAGIVRLGFRVPVPPPGTF